MQLHKQLQGLELLLSDSKLLNLSLLMHH